VVAPLLGKSSWCEWLLPLAKAGGVGAYRTALQDSHRCQVGNGYSIPGLASAFCTVIRATRSDGKSDAGKGKAPPSRRFKSVRCRLNSVALAFLAGDLGSPRDILRRIERAMDRSKRANNPECFDEKGRWKKGARMRVRSKRYQAHHLAIRLR
jgi:hypothetical protein